jgi:phosphoserine / homoserine phosphotransferase
LEIICLDLEGVLIPEIWVKLAERTGIDALKATTRDIADYDVLMRQRLDIMAEHKLGIDEISTTVATMRPLDGAESFLERLRERFQVVILSDTFYEITKPLMRQLGWPTLLCHTLVMDSDGAMVDYRLRLDDHKRRAVKAFKLLNYHVLATGDSYNDIGMLTESDAGIFYRAPPNVESEFPDFPVVRDYDALLDAFAEASARLRHAAPTAPPRKG